jgi:arsenate reductase
LESTIEKELPEVLFVCVHNAGRSQMAAGLLSKRAGGRVHVRSAGSTPAKELNPQVVEAMREVGINISREFPKPLTDEFVRELDDPAGKDLETVRRIRDEIDARVTALVDQLAAKPI